MRTIGQAGCRTIGRFVLGNRLGLAFALMVSVPAAAEAPVAGMLAAGLVGQAQYGTIKGRLVWGGPVAPPARVEIAKGTSKKDPNICAKDRPIVSREIVVDPKTLGVAHGFAYLVRPNGTNPDAVKALIAKHPKVELDQLNCEFLPYVLALHQDQTVVFKSSDATNHNVRFTGFNNGGFNQIVGAGGQIEKNLVAERFPIPVECNIHEWMKCYLMVFDHPFFTITGTDGSFELKGVPAGAQNLIVNWPKLGFVTPGLSRGMPVTVKAGEVTDVGDIKIDPANPKLAK
jgi:hypothetical protein